MLDGELKPSRINSLNIYYYSNLEKKYLFQINSDLFKLTISLEDS